MFVAQVVFASITFTCFKLLIRITPSAPFSYTLCPYLTCESALPFLVRAVVITSKGFLLQQPRNTLTACCFSITESTQIFEDYSEQHTTTLELE